MTGGLDISLLELSASAELCDFNSNANCGVFHTPEWMAFVLSVSDGIREKSLAFSVDGRVVAIVPLLAQRARISREYWSHFNDEYGGLIGIEPCDELVVRQIENHLFENYPRLRVTPDPLLPQYLG